MEKVGAAAEPPPSGSLVQIGSSGVWREKRFVVAGRIVYQGEDETWSHWHIIFGDGSSGWITDARRLYAVLLPTPPPEPLVITPKPGEQRVFRWNDTRYYMTDVRRAWATGREGELPLGSSASSEMVCASLLTPGGRAGCILYGMATPQLLLGDCAEFDDLHLTNLRHPEDLPGAPDAAEPKCPTCGRALPLRTGELALSVTCSHCLSLFDPARTQHASLRRFEEHRGVRPLIPLGARGIFGGADYEVVGFQARTAAASTGAILCDSRRYVLFHPVQGFRFLTESNGHWSDCRFLRAHPDALAGARPDVSAQDKIYQHFSTANVETVYAEGEFPWRVLKHEPARLTTYIRPPSLLSSENSAGQTMWFSGEYRTGQEIWSAFQFDGDPPPVHGVAEHQPRPVRDFSRIWTFGVLLLLIVLVAGLACDTFLTTLPPVFWIASLLTLVPAAVKTVRIAIFERQRWRASDYKSKNAVAPRVSVRPGTVPPRTHEQQTSPFSASSRR